MQQKVPAKAKELTKRTDGSVRIRAVFGRHSR
jgi:hypothetical protein